MRAVVQRSKNSRVMVEDVEKGRINGGLVVLLGIKRGDGNEDAVYLLDKIINLRIFPDEDGKMNRSLLEVGGEILLISQFTLYGDARKGRRPGFSEAELSDVAQPLFDFCLDWLNRRGVRTQTGEFGADMMVEISNDGPCTILLDSEKIF